MIAIVDYGVGNLKNVYKAFSKLDLDVVITSDKKVIDESKAIILPGVGAYKDAVNNLKKLEIIDCLRENVNKGKPFLGICLGMQLLYERSYEDGQCDGLGFLKGEIVRFGEGLKVPHMGWNNVVKAREDEIAKNIKNGEYVYFVHSYYLKPEDENEIVLWADYGVKVPGVIRRENIIGMQFHPEKSGQTGLKLLNNFKELIK